MRKVICLGHFSRCTMWTSFRRLYNIEAQALIEDNKLGQ